ncbi:MAG TPA: phage tail tube protein [Thermoguttaceae bacterium]|nr:phage tail tube protein [Thermoguttaceae bacterium]
MAATPISAYGTTVTLTTGGLAAGVKSISGPGVSVDMLDVSTHDAGTGYRSYVPGLADGGELTLEIVFDDANEVLWKAQVRAAVNIYTIVWPATITWVFSGHMTGFEPSAAVDGDLSATITVKVTGVITYDTD